MSTADLILAKCPRRGDPQKPTTLSPAPFLTMECRTGFDGGVFRAMMVGGLGEIGMTPTFSDHMLSIVYGAIRLACLGEGVDPSSFKLLMVGEAVYGGWELTCEALATNRLCPTVTESLQRLLAPYSNGRQNDADDRSAGNMLLEECWNGPNGYWWWRNWYTAAHTMSRLDSKLVRIGPRLNQFKADERKSLQRLINGVMAMEPLARKAFSR